MDYDAYIITCLTNMHVGSGDTNFGVVDNLVQRDPVTGYPTIHSPSLKGALREYCSGRMDDAVITDIFGSKNTSSSQQRGSYRFFSGTLLSLPVRSESRPYYMATTSGLIQAFISTLEQFSITLKHKGLEDIVSLTPEVGNPLIGDGASAGIEDVQGKHSPVLKGLDTFLGPDLAVFHDNDFKDVTACLPVIARNNLENGESKNLWYEEIVPHQSRFFCIIGKGENHAADFETTLKEDNIQIGANASIGYGYTQIRKLTAQGVLDE